MSDSELFPPPGNLESISPGPKMDHPPQSLRIQIPNLSDICDVRGIPILGPHAANLHRYHLVRAHSDRKSSHDLSIGTSSIAWNQHTYTKIITEIGFHVGGSWKKQSGKASPEIAVKQREIRLLIATKGLGSKRKCSSRCHGNIRPIS